MKLAGVFLRLFLFVYGHAPSEKLWEGRPKAGEGGLTYVIATGNLTLPSSTLPKKEGGATTIWPNETNLRQEDAARLCY